jgi:hypothetical protein
VLTSSPNEFALLFARGQTLDLSFGALQSTSVTSWSAGIPVGTVQLCASNPNGGGGAELAEVIAVKGTLSDANVANLTEYYHAKFGL